MPSNSPVPASSVLALLAIECAEPGLPPRWTAGRDHAETIVAAIAADLVKLAPEAHQLDLAAASAVYDQAQILRPGWPVHAALLAMQARIAKHAGVTGTLGLGAKDGTMPDPVLQPEPGLFGSPLLILPWVLHGEAALARELASRFERELLERGMGGGELALAVQEAFGVQVRHVQHLTLFDLCAVTCAQYEHAGFGPVWQLIENALLTPAREHDLKLDGATWTGIGSEVRVSGLAPPMALYRAILAAHGITLSASA